MRTETTIYKELLRQIKIFEEESTKKEYNICLNTLKGRIEALCFVLSVKVPEQNLSLTNLSLKAIYQKTFDNIEADSQFRKLKRAYHAKYD